MVSSSHPAVTRVMLDVLRDGGNAMDAAVAGSLVQPVYEPHQTNHAGTVVTLPALPARGTLVLSLTP